MAKKKSASPTVTGSSAAKKTASKSAGIKSAGNGAPFTSTSALSAEQIGMTAGSVWLYLSDNGSTSLANLKKAINAPGDLIAAAVGWLAREEKIEFSSSGKSVTLSLK